MAPPASSLIVSAAQLKELPEETVRQIVELADRESRRSATYAMLGMACGTASFLASLGACVYLVIAGHETAAGLVFGTTLVAIAGNMIRARQ